MPKLLFISILLCQTATAATSVNINTLVKDFHYTEYSDSGRILNRETGLLNGFGLSLNHYQPRMDYGFNTESYSALIDYNGETQAGIPHTTQTDTEQRSVGLYLRYHLIPQQHFIVFDYSRDYWIRNILPKGNVLGLYEFYRWTTLKLGYEYIYHFSHHQLQFGVKYLMHTNSEMEIDFKGIKPTIIPLKNAQGWQSQFKYIFSLNKYWDFSIQYQWSNWSSKKSDSVTTDSNFGKIRIHEPRSSTINEILFVTVKYNF